MIYDLKNSIKTIKNIIAQKNYFLIFSFTSIISFAVFYFLTLSTTADQSLRIFVMMSGFWYTLLNFFILSLVSILFGVYTSVFLYRIRLIKSKKRDGLTSSLFGGGGFVSGLFSAGCPTCGSVLFGLVGTPLALSFLPFGGLELKALSVLLLAVSIHMLSKSLFSCEIKK